MKITDRGVHHNDRGGLIIMLGCCGMPGGVNHNSFIIMINPPGRTTKGGGVNENLTADPRFS